jgi:magnesium transporter
MAAKRTLVSTSGELSEVSLDDFRRRLEAGEKGFWLDIEGPEEADYELLLDGFGFHMLTVDDVRVQNQRPKLDEFPGYAFAVLFTARLADDELMVNEHHMYLSEHWLVTVHHEPAPALDALRRRISESADVTRGSVTFLQYLVVNALVECLFPVLDELDETIDAVEDGITRLATPETLVRITTLRHAVTDLRRILSPQRDVFQRLLTHSLKNPDAELTLYWRDVYDHLVRQYEQIDSLRDLLTGTMDVYLSTVSNRLNRNMQQLTVIACVFLPLTFITGVFGMNFGVLVSLISGPGALLVGAAAMALSLALQLYFFRRQGWI